MQSTKSNWRKLAVAGLMAVSCAALPARADDAKPADKPTTPPPGAGEGGRPDLSQILKMQRERLDQLNLTDDQKKKLDEIFATAADDLKKADAGDRTAIGRTLTDVREKSAAVLTDDQKTKMQAGRTATGLGAGAGATAAGRPANVADRLQAALDKADLSADQKEKVKPVVEEVRKKFDEVRSQILGSDRAAMREKIKAILDDTRDKLKDILTPEQAEKVKAELEAGRPAGARPGADAPAKPADKPADK